MRNIVNTGKNKVEFTKDKGQNYNLECKMEYQIPTPIFSNNNPSNGEQIRTKSLWKQSPIFINNKTTAFINDLTSRYPNFESVKLSTVISDMQYTLNKAQDEIFEHHRQKEDQKKQLQ